MVDVVVFLAFKMFISHNSYIFTYSRNAQVTFVENPPILNTGAIVNRALPSLNGGSLEITLTVLTIVFLIDSFMGPSVG